MSCEEMAIPVVVAPIWRGIRREQQKYVYTVICIVAFHGIGGCFFCLIDIPVRMDNDLFGPGAQVDPSDPLPSNGRVWGTAFGTASGAGTSGSWRVPITASAIFVTDSIGHRQIEPRPTWCTTARHGISCDRRWPCLSP